MMTGDGWRWLGYVINYYCTHLNESFKSYLYDVQIHYNICKTNNSGNLLKNVLFNMFCNVFTNSVLVVDCINGYCLPPISNDYISGGKLFVFILTQFNCDYGQRPTEFFRYASLLHLKSISVSCYFNLPTNCLKKVEENDSFLFLQNGFMSEYRFREVPTHSTWILNEYQFAWVMNGERNN